MPPTGMPQLSGPRALPSLHIHRPNRCLKPPGHPPRLVLRQPTSNTDQLHMNLSIIAVRALRISLLYTSHHRGRPYRMEILFVIPLLLRANGTRDLILGDDALSTKPVCIITAQLISATRGRASQPKVLAMATDCSATCQQG